MLKPRACHVALELNRAKRSTGNHLSMPHIPICAPCTHTHTCHMKLVGSPCSQCDENHAHKARSSGDKILEIESSGPPAKQTSPCLVASLYKTSKIVSSDHPAGRVLVVSLHPVASGCIMSGAFGLPDLKKSSAGLVAKLAPTILLALKKTNQKEVMLWWNACFHSSHSLVQQTFSLLDTT